MSNALRLVEINLIDLQESKIPLALFRRSDFSFDRITCPQAEPPHLAWADVNVVGSR